MNAKTRHIPRWGIVVAMLVALIAAHLGAAVTIAAPNRAPAQATLAATLPTETCSVSGPSERTCELWAKSGSLTLPDAVSVPIWGYSDTVDGVASSPGPTLVAIEGETLHIILHNDLAEATSLTLGAQEVVPDVAGVAPGGTKIYTFPALAPGTHLYEAGAAPSGARQVAMGLYGALVVRPAANTAWAYGDDSAFDDEALLVLGAVDPDLHADPNGFDLVHYAPRHWTINGKAYPDTEAIETAPGRTVLLRVLNASLDHQPVGVLGLHMHVVGRDGQRVVWQHEIAAETLAAGETLDAIVAIPADAPADAHYAVMDTSGRLHNAGAVTAPGGPLATGGLLTFLTTPAVAPGPDVLGPLTSDVSVAPSLTAGGEDLTLTASLSEAETGGADVVAAEFFVDALGDPGTGTPMAGAFGPGPVSVSTTISAADLASLSSGEYILYLRGQDGNGNWGPVGAAILHMAVDGPTVTGVVLTPNPTNGAVDVALQATADARAVPGVNLQAAEYFVDAPGADGAGTALVLNTTEPVASLNGTIVAVDIAALPEGQHTIYIHAQDALGTWGPFTEATLHVDKSGPELVSATAVPNPTNGKVGLSPSLTAVGLTAVVGDPASNGVQSSVARVEGFIDTVGDPGTGFLLAARDGLYNQALETTYVHIPLTTIDALDGGTHILYVRGMDAAGNWGPAGTVELVVDKTGPEVTGVNLDPEVVRGGGGSIVTATATDPQGVALAEWFLGDDPGAGHATALAPIDGAFGGASEGVSGAINTRGLHPGTHIVSVRGRDMAGNWGPVATATLTVQSAGPGPQMVFRNDFGAAGLTGWSASVGNVTVTPEAGMGIQPQGLEAVVDGGQPAYLVDATPEMESLYGARFYFQPHGTDTGSGEHGILVGYDAFGVPILGIAYERSADNPGEYEVRAWVRHAHGVSYTNWFDIADAPTLLEIGWESDSTGTLLFSVNGELQQALKGIDTSAFLLDEVHLGPSIGLTDGSLGAEWYADFISMRTLSVQFISRLPMVWR